VVLPQFEFQAKKTGHLTNAPRVPEGFAYRSNTNERWLTVAELRKMLEDLNLGSIVPEV
jgi:hypothetical protein